MGCDIHIVVERKKSNGRYVAINTMNYHHLPNGRSSFPPAKDRNYMRFAALAGVRGEGPDPKGFPQDASQSAKYLYGLYETDYHSPSYMSIKDAVPIFLATERTPPETDSWEAKYAHNWLFGVDSEVVDECRIVFWFDN